MINVNELVDGRLTGCATMVFQGDLPTTAELRGCDLVVMGTWGWHKVFGSRFDVDAWGLAERAASKPVAEPVARKTRRLDVVPEAPPKPVQAAKPVRAPKPATRSQRRSAPTNDQVAQTNDWYAQTNGLGDALDAL